VRDPAIADAGVDGLRTAANEIEHKLEELRAMVPPAAWLRVEDILERVVSLYGHGLDSALGHARAAGACGDFDERVANDELLASLLVLHGLHPLSVGERVTRAIARTHEALGADAGHVELVAVDPDGTVHLRATGLGGGAMSARLAESALRRAIEDAAPEVPRVDIAGVPPPPAPVAREPQLVQLRRSREAR
jgi:hypothetical protein